MADLFEQFDRLFRKQKVVDPPHPIVVNRFLSSDPDFASAAKEILESTWDPDFTWELWRLLVPRSLSAPHMRYTAMKKLGDPTPLVQRIMEVDAVRRERAEEKVRMAEEMDGEDPVAAQYDGMFLSLCWYYGVDPDEERKKQKEDDDGDTSG